MNFLVWIIVGLIAGAIAKAIMPGKDPGGVIITMLLGIVGAIVGGWVGSLLLGTRGDGFNLMTIVLAIIVSLIVLAIYRLLTGRSLRA